MQARSLAVTQEYGIPAGNEWYSHVPNAVTERDDGKVTIYWDKSIKTGRKVSYNMPDVVVIDREENTWYSGFCDSSGSS